MPPRWVDLAADPGLDTLDPGRYLVRRCGVVQGHDEVGLLEVEELDVPPAPDAEVAIEGEVVQVAADEGAASRRQKLAAVALMVVGLGGPIVGAAVVGLRLAGAASWIGWVALAGVVAAVGAAGWRRVNRREEQLVADRGGLWWLTARGRAVGHLPWEQVSHLQVVVTLARDGEDEAGRTQDPDQEESARARDLDDDRQWRLEPLMAVALEDGRVMVAGPRRGRGAERWRVAEDLAQLGLGAPVLDAELPELAAARPDRKLHYQQPGARQRLLEVAAPVAARLRQRQAPGPGSTGHA